MNLSYFLYYLVVGFVALAALSSYRLWQQRHDEPDWFAVTEMVTWKMRVINAIFASLAVVFIFVPLWPWILSIEFRFPWHKFKFWTDKAERDIPWSLPDDEPEF